MPTGHSHRRSLPPLRHRLVAAGGVALVLVLSVLAACPELHAWLHRGAAQPDHECAITLYQHGVPASAGSPVLAVAALVALVWVAALPAELHLAPRHHSLPPGNAPPAR